MPPPIRDDVPSHLEEDVRNHAKTLTALTERIFTIEKILAVQQSENETRDAKVNSISGLGRTVLVAVITLFVGAVFYYLAAGGFRVPPA